MFQESVAQLFDVPNMREGFWKYRQNVTVAGFGYNNNSQFFNRDSVKVKNTISIGYQPTELSPGKILFF